MGIPRWWSQRRVGIFVHANLAAVPAWAPVGQDPAWYRAHVDGAVADVLLHPSPMAETLAHHRDRWGHVERFDDFLPFLTFDEFDADQWVSFAAEVGAGYVVATARHHDGLCWWDAPGATATVIADGPRRNVLGDLASACDRSGVAFGTS
jgi:alpha-L-fucosidase